MDGAVRVIMARLGAKYAILGAEAGLGVDDAAQKGLRSTNGRADAGKGENVRKLFG